jgi:hypothetical protein
MPVWSLWEIMINVIFQRAARSNVGWLFFCEHWTFGGTPWCSWLRHCTLTQKLMGLIPDGVIGIFHWHNPAGCTIALRLTQPVTEMSTRNISWLVHRADNLTTCMCWLSWNLGASASWNSRGLTRPVMGLLYFCLYYLFRMFRHQRDHITKCIL